MSKTRNYTSISISVISIIGFLLFILLQIVLSYFLIKTDLSKQNQNGIFCLLVGTIIGLFIIIDFVTMMTFDYILKYLEYKTEMHSKHYLHYSDLDFETPINDKRINNPDALSILMKLNDNLIPSYLKYKEVYNRLTNLKTLSNQDRQTKQNKIVQTNNDLNDLKQQILSKTQQIKNILDHEKEINVHKDFINQYQDIERITDKLTH